jgi:hypothetical protein
MEKATMSDIELRTDDGRLAGTVTGSDREGWQAQCAATATACDWLSSGDGLRAGWHLDELLDHIDEDHPERNRP